MSEFNYISNYNKHTTAYWILINSLAYSFYISFLRIVRVSVGAYLLFVVQVFKFQVYYIFSG